VADLSPRTGQCCGRHTSEKLSRACAQAQVADGMMSEWKCRSAGPAAPPHPPPLAPPPPHPGACSLDRQLPLHGRRLAQGHARIQIKEICRKRVRYGTAECKSVEARGMDDQPQEDAGASISRVRAAMRSKAKTAGVKAKLRDDRKRPRGAEMGDGLRARQAGAAIESCAFHRSRTFSRFSRCRSAVHISWGQTLWRRRPCAAARSDIPSSIRADNVLP